MRSGFEVGVGGEFVAEVGDGGGDDGVVEEGLVAGVGDEGGVEELAGEAGEAAAGAEDELGGGVGEEIAISWPPPPSSGSPRLDRVARLLESWPAILQEVVAASWPAGGTGASPVRRIPAWNFATATATAWNFLTASERKALAPDVRGDT